MGNIEINLRGLIPTATELKTLTTWSEAVIEDYLNIFDNFSTLTDGVISLKRGIKETVRVTTTPYEISRQIEVVFFDTDDNEIAGNLLPGEEGKQYRLVNVGSSGNNVILAPFAGEKLFGATASEFIADQEALIITFNSVEGWN